MFSQSFRRYFLLLALPTLLVSCADEEEPEPETDPRDKFVGSWMVSEEVAGTSTGGYPSVVTLDSTNTSRIVIGNIYNLGENVKIKALVAGNALDISAQTVSGVNISGTGSFLGSSFVLNYTANDGSLAESVKATYSK